MLPWASQATATTLKPAITALAGFVPWAETGMRQTSRWASPRLGWYARMVEEPRVLALGARVRLQGDRGEAGDLAEPALEVGEQLVVAAGLLGGGEGVELPELGPGDRDHLRRRVELHRAGAERDHRVGEREVARLQPAAGSAASRARSGSG